MVLFSNTQPPAHNASTRTFPHFITEPCRSGIEFDGGVEHKNTIKVGDYHVVVVMALDCSPNASLYISSTRGLSPSFNVIVDGFSSGLPLPSS